MLNPSRLTLARKRQGLTLRSLSELTGLSTKSLSTYENGRQEPVARTVALLADVLDVTEQFLVGTDVDEIPVDAVSFRALSKMPARLRDRGLASGRVAIMINDWIEERFALPALDVPPLTGRVPEHAAEELRAQWGLGARPIRNMIHLLEAHGVRIYSLTSDNSELDAFSLFWRSQPFVFLGTTKSAERSRFDAAHELGHLVLHRGDQQPHGLEAERQANQFASAFLMPRPQVLAQELRNANVARVLRAKQDWKVSAMAMVHRANELGLMTEWSYRTTCTQLARMGFRRSEPGGMPRESSQLLTKVMQELRSTGRGVADVATDIGITSDEVHAHMFGLTPVLLTGSGASHAGERKSMLKLVT